MFVIEELVDNLQFHSCSTTKRTLYCILLSYNTRHDMQLVQKSICISRFTVHTRKKAITTYITPNNDSSIITLEWHYNTAFVIQHGYQIFNYYTFSTCYLRDLLFRWRRHHTSAEGKTKNMISAISAFMKHIHVILNGLLSHYYII